MVLNNDYWVKDGSLYWYDEPGREEIAVSFDKVKMYYLPRDYWEMTPEERKILDAQTHGIWREIAST